MSKDAAPGRMAVGGYMTPRSTNKERHESMGEPKKLQLKGQGNVDLPNVPEGWYVLFDEETLESIVWTEEVQLQYMFPNEWFTMLDWAVSQTEASKALQEG